MFKPCLLLLSTMLFSIMTGCHETGPPPETVVEEDLDAENFSKEKRRLEATLTQNLGENGNSLAGELDIWRRYYEDLTRIIAVSQVPDGYRYRIAAAAASQVIRLDTLVELGVVKLGGETRTLAEKNTRDLANERWVRTKKDGKAIGRPALLKDLLQSGAARDEIIRTVEPLRIADTDVGAIEVQMAGPEHESIRLGWSHSPKFDLYRWRKISPPAGEGVVQRLNLVGTHGLPVKTKLNFLFLDLRQGGGVSFERIRVLPRDERYLEKPMGVVHERLGHNVRRALFQAAKTQLTFRIPIPAEAPSLFVELGSLPGSQAVDFKIELQDGQSTILLEQRPAPGAWENVRVDLSPWAGREVSLVLRNGGPGTALWANPVIRSPRSELPDIVWYLIDCLRADHMGLYGYELPTTPFMDEFFAKGLVFEKAYTNGNNTRSSVASLFTGLTCSAIGTHEPWGRVDEAHLTITEVLREMGYRTVGLVTNANGGGFAGLQQGYSELMELDWIQAVDFNPMKDGKPRLSTKVVKALGERLKQPPGTPLFVYFHTLDLHDPFRPPEGYENRFDLSAYDDHRRRWDLTDEEVLNVRKYDAELRYSDDVFREFIDEYGRNRSLDQTMVWLLSDHGEFLGEHKIWHHAPYFPPRDEILEIPLAVVYPRLGRQARLTSPGQLLDVGDTTLGLLNRPEAVRPWSLGRDLTSYLKGGAEPGRWPIISENYSSEHLIQAMIIGDYAFRRGVSKAWVDRADTAGENPKPQAFDAVLQAYRALSQTIAAHSRVQAEHAVSASELEQLRALGYIQ